MLTVTLQEARATLPDLLHRLIPGEEVRIIENGRIVGRLLPGASRPPVQPSRQADSMTGSDDAEGVAQWPCRAGSAKGKIRIAADFDAPLEEFSEYME